jgi:hypothetical protein
MILFNGTLTAESVMKIPQSVYSELLRLIGKNITVEVRESKPKRSLNQNAYMHSVVYRMIADSLGYADNELGELTGWIKIQIGHVDEKGLPKPTRHLNTSEMESYLSSVRTWASTMGIWIPQPNEVSQ